MLCNQKFKPDARSNYALSVACPLWVKSRQMQCKTACPLYPQKTGMCGALVHLLWADSGHLLSRSPDRYAPAPPEEL